MKKVFTKGFFIVATMILFLAITFPVVAQYTKTSLETGGLYTALAKDASNNVYVTRVKAGTGGATYEVVKYTNGTGIPVSIYSPLTHEIEDFPWGLAIASNGDVYISTDFTGGGGGAIIRLNAASAYSPTTVQTGRYFTALTIDASNNLYAVEYDSGPAKFAVVKYTNPATINSVGTTLYSGITSTAGLSYPTGIALAANGDIFVTDVFNIDGGLTYKGGIIKLTAPAYTKTNISTDTYATALYLDGAGDLYATENAGAGYKLNKYTAAAGAPTAVYTPLHSNGIYYPYGIAVINTNNIFVADGDDGINGGEVMQLINISAPTTQATDVTFSAISGYGATASWTNGNGSSRAVFIANVSTGSPVPVDGTTYTPNTAFTSGTQIGASGWYCIYNGTGSSVNVTGLSLGSTYRVMTVEYNGTGATSHYLTATATNNPANVQTSILVDVDVSSIVSSLTYTPGTNLTQTITVNNFGPNDVIGETITNALPAGSTWTAVFAGGATGTANGSGSINVLVNIPFNGSITYTVTIPIPNTQTGPLTLTTTVTAPVGVTDVNLANNQYDNTIQPPPIGASTSQTNVSCNGGANGSASVIANGGTSPYTYSWAPSGGTSATATGLAAGTYTVTITDANAATTTKTFTITEPPVLIASAGAQTNVSCNGGSNGSATVSVSGGTGSYTYSWAPSGGTAATATGLTAGTYTVTVTDANSCTTTQSFTITEPPVLSASVGAQTNVSCNGGSNGSATVAVSGGTGGYTYSWAPSGGTAATASGLTAGTYTVTVTDANGCTTTQSFTINQPSVLSASAGAQTNVSCNGGTNGSATVTASGGTGAYTYSWAPSGGTAATATALAAGTYTVTVMDANGCTTTQSFTITEPSILSASAGAQTNVACNGGASGSATVTASGGTGPYTYSWAPSGGTAATASALAAGTYTVTVTDANGCTATQSFTITQPSVLSASAGAQTNVSCNNGSNGSATVAVSGGTGGYTYSWAPSGGTAATATGLAAGTYTVTVTDANGCTATQSFTITQPLALSPSAGAQTNVSCNGGSNGSATVTASGGTGAYTYSWSPTGGTAATASGLTAGTYTVTVMDANGCTATQTFTITEPPVLSTTPVQTNVSCNGGTNGSATVTASGGTPGYTYSWAPSGGTAATATGLAAGTYTVTVMDANGCTATQSFTITQPPVLSASAGAQTNVACNGGSNGSATVSVSGGTPGYAYSWAPSGGTAATATGLAAGTYTVTVTDANGCTATQSFTITQPSVLNASVGAQTNVSCNGGTNGSATVAVSGGSGGYTYSWAPSGGTAATATGLAAGTYTVTITDANSCMTTQSFTIIEPPVLSASVGAQTNVSCNGGSNGSAIVAVSGGTGAYTYVWSPSGGTAATATGLTAGTYTVTVTDANGCTATQSFTILQPATVSITTATLPDSNFGSSYSSTLNATGGSGSYSYAVTAGTLPGGLILSSSGNLSGTPSAVGTFNFTVTATESGCNQTASKPYTVVINKGSQTITFSPFAAVTYGDAPITLGGTSSSGLPVSYNSSNTNVATISGNILTILSAGTSTITASQTGNGNFNAATQVGQTLTVNQRALVISATASNKVYDGNTTASVTLTDNRVTGDVFTVTADPATFANANVGIGKTVSVNNINIPAATAVNYTFNTSTTTTANITAKPITVTAVAKSKIYGDADPALTYVLSTPLIGGDAFTGALSRDAGNNIGTYVIRQNTLALSNNYSITYTSGIFTITAKDITGAFTASNKMYDGNTTANILARSLAGVLPGDVADVILSGGVATFADANIGTGKVVSQSGMSLTGTKALNYNLTGVGTTTADITAKAIIVIADAKNKVYGEADPALTYTLSAPLVSGDTFTGALARDAGNNVGTYTINQNTLALSNNYALTYQQANFVINKKALTITADDKSRLQGAANPTLTVSYNGFVNGENSSVLTAQPVLSTTATTASLPGNYPITAGLATAANYAISYNNGVLKVVESVISAITLTATPLYENNGDNALAGTFGTVASDPAGTYTYTLVSGAGSADNAKFNISGNNIRATNSLDFEGQSSFAIRVKTTSQYGVGFEQSFTISLTDVNEAPTLATPNNQQICYTIATQSVALSGITSGPETAQNTTITVSSNNAALFESLTVAKTGTSGTVSYKVKAGESGTAIITVTVMDNGGTANGGVDTYSKTFTITVFPLPNVAITSDKGTSVSKGEIIKLTASGGVSYVWRADNSIMSGQNTATLTIRPSVNTIYTVTATNANGCSQTSDFSINVVSDFAKIKITNLLTPNGDGFNDKWIVENIDLYPNNEVKIFDRAGRLIYAKKTYDNSWDGKFNGVSLNENTYYYVVDFGANFKKLKGFITIVRE